MSPLTAPNLTSLRSRWAQPLKLVLLQVRSAFDVAKEAEIDAGLMKDVFYCPAA